MSGDNTKRQPLALLALALAWIVPGAGHLYLGRPVRGAIIFVVIAATFWAGIAMGGVMTVDRQSEPWWFAADMLAGVHGLVSWGRQHRVQEQVITDAELTLSAQTERTRLDRPTALGQEINKVLAEKNLALVPPADTVARAYAGVAGLINLLCIFDAAMLALMGATGEPPRPAPAKPPASP